MLRYAARRLAQTIPTLLVISVLTFLLVRLIPGDPATLIAVNLVVDLCVGVLDPRVRYR